MRKLVLDTETTGLDVNNGDRILEIGILELYDDIKTGKSFHSYINPETKINIDAKKIHNIDEQFLNDKPKFYEIIDDLNKFIGNDPLIIHNANFDKKFLDFEFENCGYEPMSNEIIDTIILARKEFPGQSVSLDSLCRKLKIDNSNRKIHGAIKDAELLLAVYLKLTTGKQVSLSFNDTNQEKNIDLDENQDENDKIIMKDRSTNFTYPKKELLDHKDFIKSIKNSIWSKL